MTWPPSWSSDLDVVNKLAFPLPIKAPSEIWLCLAQWFLRIRCLKCFPYMSLWKTSDPWDGVIFDPRTLLVEVHKIKLHTKYQRPGSSSFRQEDFKVLIIWPRCCEQTFVHPAREGSLWNLALIGLVVSEEKTFEEWGQMDL